MAEKQKESWEDFEKRLSNVKLPNFVKILEDLEKKGLIAIKRKLPVNELQTVLKIEVCGKPDDYDWVLSFYWPILKKFMRTEKEKKKFLWFLRTCSDHIRKIPISK